MKVTIEWSPNDKQMIAYNYLNDKETTELLYGGGAGGGKSFLGCVWIISSCLKYAGSRWLVGRAILKSLKESTLLTFFDVCKTWGLKAGVDYTYNASSNVVKFKNESEVYLKDLFLYPSDPEFDELGSTEYTGAFIDECSQVTHKAKSIVMSRIRYKLNEFGIIPKLLLCSNPAKNFMYYDFYKPSKDNTLPSYKKFVSALVGDNPYISNFYIDNLNKLDKNTKERLLFGNWDYEDDPARLFDYDKIVDMFTLKPNKTGVKYLSVDVARFGDDKIVIFLWDGLHVEQVFTFSKQSTLLTEQKIEEIRNQYNIPRSRVVVDEDGVGGGVVDHLSGVKGFVNNGKAYETLLVKNKERVREEAVKIHNYGNLKAQCYFKLSDYVNDGRISFYNEIIPSVKQLLIEDLDQIKRRDPDKDGKLLIIPKEDIKERLGRSTDYGDAFMMRMLFEVKPNIGCAF